jgi:hypothetical protein
MPAPPRNCVVLTPQRPTLQSDRCGRPCDLSPHPIAPLDRESVLSKSPSFYSGWMAMRSGWMRTVTRTSPSRRMG